MTEHEASDHGRPASPSANGPVDSADQERPENRSGEAVGVGIADEVQGGDPGDARHDADRLDPGKDEDRPEQIEELGREEKGAQGDARSDRLGRQRHAEMAQEHLPGS